MCSFYAHIYMLSLLYVCVYIYVYDFVKWYHRIRALVESETIILTWSWVGVLSHV